MQARLRNPYVLSRGRESTKLCYDFAMYITSIIMMLITIVLMIDRGPMHKNACYVHIIGDEIGCKTNSVFYFHLFSAASTSSTLIAVKIGWYGKPYNQLDRAMAN